LAFRFSREAEKLVQAFVKAVNGKIDELGFKIGDSHRKDIIQNIEHFLKFLSIKHAKRRGTRIVEERDVKETLRRISPTRVVRHGLRDPKISSYIEKLKEKYFRIVEQRLVSSEEPRVLDAGCGYGRQLMEYRRWGLDGEFIGVDIDKDAIRYAKSVEPSVRFIGAGIEGTLPFKACTFDAVVCVGVVHETTQHLGIHKAIEDFARVLKPDGLLYLVDAFTRSRITSGIAYFVWKIAPKIGRYSHIDRIKRILEQNRFTRVTMEKAFIAIAPLIDTYSCKAIVKKPKTFHSS